MDDNRVQSVDKFFHLALVVLFLLTLSLPVLLLIVGPKEEIAVNEKRKLAVFPELSLEQEAISSFPEKFEIYFNDHFGARKHLIHIHHYIKTMWLKRSPVEKVLIGKDDWLFYTDMKMVDSYLTLSLHPSNTI